MARIADRTLADLVHQRHRSGAQTRGNKAPTLRRRSASPSRPHTRTVAGSLQEKNAGTRYPSALHNHRAVHQTLTGLILYVIVNPGIFPVVDEATTTPKPLPHRGGSTPSFDHNNLRVRQLRDPRCSQDAGNTRTNNANVGFDSVRHRALPERVGGISLAVSIDRHVSLSI